MTRTCVRRGGALLPTPLVLVAAPVGAQQLTPDDIRDRVDAATPGAVALYRELLSLPNDAHDREDILTLIDGWRRRSGSAASRHGGWTRRESR